MSEAALILGMRITRDRKNRTIKIDQAEYINKMLKDYKMEDCKPNVTPMSSYKLSSNDCAVESDENEHADTTEEVRVKHGSNSDPNIIRVYQSMVGSLNYASISTRPDITFAVNVLSRYLQHPGPNHVTACKTVLRYLRGTSDVGLIFDGKNHAADEQYPFTRTRLLF